MDTNKTITHLSLCSGYEGIGLGLRSVLPNLREVAFVEREGFVIANLVAKMEAGELDAAPVYTDVKTFPYGKFRGCVDILSGGFPCQPFSSAGKRQATEDPRHLFPYIADGIRECQPRIVFLENVQGILSCTTGDGEPVLQYVLRTLEEMGYRATAGIFSAEEVGAPHQRKRVYILGYASSLGSYRGIENQNDEQSEVSREGLERVRGEEELGYSSSNGHKDGCSEARGEERQSQQGWMQEPQRGSNATTELANTNISGGNKDRQPTKLWSSCTEQSPINRWPARPSQTQQEWEEPRVVVNSTSKGLEGGRGQSLQGADQGLAGTDRSDGQAEPQLGRATNGSSSRVDRLRLLGNGVVPQTAAKAFITLINRIDWE